MNFLLKKQTKELMNMEVFAFFIVIIIIVIIVTVVVTLLMISC